MPKNCGECKFFAWKRVVGNHCAIDESITFHATLDGLDVRYEKNGNCPLVSVPPHGRLIDADALKETLDYYIREAGWSDEINEALTWVRDEFIDHEHTIIEAEGDGT